LYEVISGSRSAENLATSISGLFRRNIWIIGSSIIAKAEKHTTQRPTGKKSWFRQEWFKCGMGWFTDFHLPSFFISSSNLPKTEKEVAAPILNECVLKSFGFNFRN
jgi:hypothetical protein